jgi:hypothetical protein
MEKSSRIAVAFVILAALHQCADAADSPSDLIVGKWKHRNEVTNPKPDDATMEFSKDGKGQFSQTKEGKIVSAKISWKVTKTYGNACIVVIDYVDPKPKEVKPMTWLLAFDGKDAFVVQPSTNRIDFYDR